MTQPCPLPARFHVLDAWRGLCALLVVLFHAPFLHPWKGAPAFANLQLCVDFFFVLSGFVLSHAHDGRLRGAGDVARFMGARFRRLWPLHAALLGVLVAVELAKLRFGSAAGDVRITAPPFSEGHTVPEIVTNLLFLQGFGLHPGLTWNGPSWSIAAEFWVSAVFAAVLLATRRNRVAVFAVLAPVSGVALWAVSPSTIFVDSSWTMLRCMLGFFTGCLVYRLRLRAPAALPFGLAEGLAVVAAALFVAGTRDGPAQLAVPLVAGLLIYVFSFERGLLSALLRRPVFQALGRWSFSIYMLHVMVFQFARLAAGFADHRLGTHIVTAVDGDRLLAFGPPGATALAMLAAIALVVVPLGAFCYAFFEVPLGRLFAPSVARPVPAIAAPTLR
jgi:peptidoglycan/LPS O-acetylase OafA/YrhL